MSIGTCIPEFLILTRISSGTQYKLERRHTFEPVTAQATKILETKAQVRV